MANVEDRVVSMAFESTKFTSGISQTMASMDKFNAALKALGASSGLDNIEKSANKISLTGPMSALDKLKAKFGRGVPEAADAFSGVEKASDKVGFGGIGTAIDKLKGKFNFPEAATGFAEVERASGRVSFSGLTQALDGLGGKFSVVSGAAAVAFGNIATRATMLGGNMVKSLTLDPVSGGLKEYETNLNSIQTILANTQASGAKLKDVQSALNELNTYSDKTIYNFSEMAKNIGTFTAAGVDLKTATGSIKGIANLAAVSGSNSQQASTAMYQLSQAISSGRVSLQDWNSVVNAGMGGTVFQRALAQTATKMGTLGDGAVTLKGKMKNVSIEGKSFRESITAKPGQKSWLTSDVLTKTLQQFTGDLSDADLAAQGFNKSEIKAIQAQAKTAQEAATHVKTLSALLDTTKEQVGSGWAATWQIIFGDFHEAPKLFTGLSNAIGGFVKHSAKSRNAVLKDWKDLGGRTLLIEGIKRGFKDLMLVLDPIKKAFRDIFPKKTGKDLYNLTVQFSLLMDKLILGPEKAESLRRSFKGFFAIIDIGKQLVGGIFTALSHLFGAVGDGSGDFLHFTRNVGDLVVAFDEWLKKGDRLHNFFAHLGDTLSKPLHLLGQLKDKLEGFFGLADKSDHFHDSIAGVGDAVKPANKAATAAKKVWEGFLHILDKIRDALPHLADDAAKAFSGVIDKIGEAFTGQSFDSITKVLQVGVLAAIAVAIKKGLGGGLNINFGQNALKGVTGVLDGLKGSLAGMQQTLHATTLLEIGAALTLLAASAVALSLVKPERLASSMTALTVGLGQLVGAMAVLNRIGGAKAGVAKASGSLILIAGALLILSASVVIFSKLDWEALGKGLAGVAGSIAIFAGASQVLSKASPRMVVAGAGIGALGAGLIILGAAMKIFATMSWADMAKGLAGVVFALDAIAISMRAMPLTMPIIGAGLILVGIGLNAVAGAVAIMGHMDVATLAKGVVAMSGALLGIAIAMNLMPPTLPITAAGLILVGIGLTSISGAIALMGNMDWGTIGKGLAGIAASLVILGLGLIFMEGTLAGAAALLVASAALAIFVPVLGMLGGMKWSTIGKGLLGIAAAFAVLAIGGALAAAPLAALGVGLGVLGVGMLALGLGVKLLASGVAILASDGAKGFGVFIAALTALILVLPKLIIDFVKGLVEIVAAIAKLAPAIVKSLVSIANTLLTGLVQLIPKAAAAISALLTAMVGLLNKNAGPLIKAGGDLLVKILKGFASHAGDVAKAVGNIITKFLNAISSKVPGIVSAGANVLAALLRGIGNNLSKVATAAASIITKYVGAIANGAAKIVTAGVSLVVKLVNGIANNIGKVVSAGANLITKFLSGIESNVEKVVSKAVTLVIKFANAMAHEAHRLVDAGGKLIVKVLNGIADSINKYEPQIIRASLRIGAAVVSGMVQGLSPHRVIEAVKHLASSLPGWAKKILKVHSPSEVFAEIGGYLSDGWALGIDQNGHKVVNAATTIGTNLINGIRSLFGIHSPSTVMHDLGVYVGQGFRDGLLAGGDDIDKAFSELRVKLSNQMIIARKSVADETKRLHHLLNEKHKDKGAISKARASLAEEESLLKKLSSAHTLMVKGLDDQKGRLVAKANEYDGVVKRLQAAKDALDQLQSDKASFVSSTIDQFSTLPDVVKETTDAEGNTIPVADQLGPYVKSLGDAVTAASTYSATLEQLRALGLDDATYRKLLSEGPADQAFANQLLAGGKTAVDGLNALDLQLAGVSGNLANTAAANLYDAGIKAAQGLVKGLTESESTLRKAMEKIATAMIKAIKKKLHIKSPSKEFEKIGAYSTKGLANGLNAGSKMVSDIASGVGDSALEALRKSMRDIANTVNTEIDSNPTITPILDLTRIKEDAKKMTDLTTPITADTSFGQATAISGAEQTRLEELAAASAGPPVLKFEQNNSSPKALSELEIYRQTNNQLSQAKSVLGL